MNENDEGLSDEFIQLSKALTEVSKLDIGEAKKTRLKALVRVLVLEKVPYDLNKLTMMGRAAIVRMKYKYIGKPVRK